MTTTGLLRGSSWALDNPPPRDPVGLETAGQASHAIMRAVTGNEARTAPCEYTGYDADGATVVICLIATVLVCAGVDPHWLADWEAHSGRITASELAADLGLTRAAGEVLEAAQRVQDQPGGNWGDAGRAAVTKAAELTVF